MKTPHNEILKNEEAFDKSEPNVQDKPDGKLVTTVTPANENGIAGPGEKDQDDDHITDVSTKYTDNDIVDEDLINSSNKGQGPAGENL